MVIARTSLRTLTRHCSKAVPSYQPLNRGEIVFPGILTHITRRHESIFASDSARAVFKTTVKERETVPTYPAAPDVPMSFRYMYPEFLPLTDWRYRNKIGERLERRDMMRRRAYIDIPEFYVGSIMRVTCSDPFAPSRVNKFLGICIDRGGVGLKAFCVLRNIIDGHGIEIQYDLYNPTVRSIDVLKLERRLDPSLYFLRDAPHHYSYVPQDFEAVPHPQGAPVPLCTTMVEMNPMPWTANWYLGNWKGMRWADGIVEDERLKEMKHFLEPLQWEQYDVIKKYRKSVTLDEQEFIYSELHAQKQAPPDSVLRPGARNQPTVPLATSRDKAKLAPPVKIVAKTSKKRAA